MTTHTFNFTGTVTHYEFSGDSDPFSGSIAEATPLTGSYTFESPAHDYQPDHAGIFYFAGGEYGIEVSVGSNNFIFHDLDIFADIDIYTFNSINQIFRGRDDTFKCAMENVQVNHEETESTNPPRFTTIIPTNPPGLLPDTRYSTELSGRREQGQFKIEFKLSSLTAAPPENPSFFTCLSRFFNCISG